MPDLSNKHGLIVGVANKRSISWAIAQAAAATGARLALTYPSERLEENVRELAGKLENPLLAPCDVASDQQITELAATIDREFGGLDFFVHGAAFAPADALSHPFIETSRESFRIALDVSAYSLISSCSVPLRAPSRAKSSSTKSKSSRRNGLRPCVRSVCVAKSPTFWLLNF